MEINTLFFSEDWKEVPVEDAYYAVKLTHDDDGRVVDSVTYVVNAEEKEEEKLGLQGIFNE